MEKDPLNVLHATGRGNKDVGIAVEEERLIVAPVMGAGKTPADGVVLPAKEGGIDHVLIVGKGFMRVEHAKESDM